MESLLVILIICFFAALFFSPTFKDVTNFDNKF